MDEVFSVLDDGTVVHWPPNTLKPIGVVYAFVSVDGEGREGVCAINNMPLVFADPALVDKMTPLAERISREAKMTIRLIKLVGREEIRTIRAWLS